ncbi:hypothetical protein [Granulosicoccus antarcticus]|uniref:Uncharacterized protein n=1 Tax=Granulosicoccus antarcticus IMCC3135 TaxID=1192854 RepID=A0A2Z2NN77_9GAMM|nr:hypothetical protein [Granulosicoccus antarcticus]ASJ72679.1 hypothetical protein IMCC3135_12955 [Granulosicoccus antarcticus IMCC3135]
MKNQKNTLLAVSIVSVLLTACSDDGSIAGSSDAATAGAPLDNRDASTPATLRSGEALPELAGGQLAQSIADETAAVTNALNGVVPGSPSALSPGEVDDDDFAPAPPSIGADVPVTYFGPSPTTVNANLVGPLQLLTAGQVDLEATPTTTVTLPLYQGRLASGGPLDGAPIWYIVTDTSDEGNAAALGLNFSAKLNFASLPAPMVDTFMSTSVRSGFYDAEGLLIVSGGPVDFTPERIMNPGSTDTQGTSNLLDSLDFQAGSVGADVGDADGFYSPLVMISNAGNHVYNAPMVAFNETPERLSEYCDGISEEESAWAHQALHDSVVAICPGESGEPGTVTLELVNGFSFGRPVLYLSTEATAEIAAALEGATYAPALGNVPVGRDDSLFSAVERLFAWTNGPTNVFDEANPQRQGFNSALVDGGGPLNVLGGVPTIATDYSPLWDVNLGEWTQEAIDNGYRSRMSEEFAILGMVERGFITGPGGSAYGSSGIIVNCPIVQRLL